SLSGRLRASRQRLYARPGQSRPAVEKRSTMLASGSRDDRGDAFTTTRLGVKAERPGHTGGSSDSTLSDARRSLIHRYMTAEAEPAPGEDADEPIVRAHSELAEPTAPPIELPPLPLLPPPLTPERAPVPVNGDAPPAAVA